MWIAEVIPVDKRRCKVLLEEGFAFALYKGEIRHYGIEAQTELSEEIYQEIQEKILRKRARERALYLLKSADKTEAQIRKKLKEGFYPEEVIEHTLGFLREYRFVDDVRYGEQYIRTYEHKKSRRQMAFDLQQKGLDRELIRELLEENGPDEEQQIRSFLSKKNYKPGESTAEEYRKLAAALVRKGFSYDNIRHIMRE